MDDAPPPVQVGQLLAGKYRVERVLGAGGMGIVVLAEHIELGQRVALKFLAGPAAKAPAALERFSRESRTAASLRSEHVARVLDVGRLEDGSPYIVMEFLEGSDLSAIVAGGPLDADTAVGFLLQACEAIAEAHALGIVHRDLKPGNLFVTTRVDGRPLVKVLDFGISKFVSDTSAGLALTSPTDIIGSPLYMSPEQFRSARDVDARTDIWSLGAILYELIAGEPPFLGESAHQVCARVLEDPPRPLVEARRGLDPGLAAVVERCLAKKRDERFQTVSELAAALEEYAKPESRGVARRIQGVARVRSNRSGGGPPDRGSVKVAVSGGTSVAWGETVPADLARKQRSQMLVIGALAGSVVVGVAAWGVVRHTGTAEHPAGLTTFASAPSALPSLTPEPPVLPAAPSSSAAPSTSATATSTSPSTSRSTPASSSTPGAHPSPVKPHPSSARPVEPSPTVAPIPTER